MVCVLTHIKRILTIICSPRRFKDIKSLMWHCVPLIRRSFYRVTRLDVVARHTMITDLYFGLCSTRMNPVLRVFVMPMLRVRSVGDGSRRSKMLTLALVGIDIFQSEKGSEPTPPRICVSQQTCSMHSEVTIN